MSVIDVILALLDFGGQVYLLSQRGFDIFFELHVFHSFVLAFDLICNFLLVVAGVTLIVGLLKVRSFYRLVFGYTSICTKLVFLRFLN